MLLTFKDSTDHNILCIGQQEVGKAMFLVGGYAQGQGKRYPGQVWLDGQDRQSQETLEELWDRVVRTGQIPTTTQTEFCLNLQRWERGKQKTLCRLRWFDLLGGISSSELQAVEQFQCCVFINGYALVNDRAYCHELEKTFSLLVAIAKLREKKPARFALIFTHCDRLASNAVARLQIEEQIAPLEEPLRFTTAKYQKFYTAVTVVHSDIETAGITEALLWLGHLTSSSPSRFGLPQAAAIALAGAGAIAAVAASDLGERPRYIAAPEQRYQQVLQIDPQNLDALTGLAALYQERGQTKQAIPVLEQVVQQQPDNIEARLNLAKGYETDGQIEKATAVYDSVLTEQENNLSALLGKALLLSQQGNTQRAKTVFAQAEAAAMSSDVKQKVRLIAQKALSTN